MRILLYLLWHCAEETVRPAIPAVAPSVVPRAGGGRIALVAEDEALGRRTPDPRRMAGASRRNRGGGAGAGARLGDAPESQLAVVVTDVVILGLDGRALVRELRLMWPGLPVVLVSGDADQAPREALISTEISYLSKPYDTAERLVTVVRLAGPPDAGVVVPSILSFINCSCTTRQIRT